MTDQHFEVSVHVVWRGAGKRSLPYVSDFLRESDLLDRLEAEGLEIMAYGTSDITGQWDELRQENDR